jgi:hypothetical protein
VWASFALKKRCKTQGSIGRTSIAQERLGERSQAAERMTVASPLMA